MTTPTTSILMVLPWRMAAPGFALRVPSLKRCVFLLVARSSSSLPALRLPIFRLSGRALGLL
eukprot:1492254-Heterocapsa_arctica.AAC.1